MHQIPIKPILEKLAKYDGYIPDTDGRWRAAKCVFHDDRSASASVSDTGFNCHACGIKGDALAIIIEREGGDYASALERASEILGISEEELSGSTVPKSRRRSVLDDGAGPVSGQRPLLSSRRRRRPIAGS